MKQTSASLPAIKLIGITVRTNNAAEMTPSRAKILPTIHRYFQEGVSEKITQRKKPGTTYSVYTDYDSDANGEYTYFFGEEVVAFNELPEGFSSITIPAQDYAKFTNAPGVMPEVCVNMWKKIWQMKPEDLTGERGYQADFELYDERASDPANAVLDIYLGIKK